MKKKTTYTDAPDEVREAIRTSQKIDDFLPPPELLIPREETRKVTLALSKRSIEFFKNTSEKTRVPYQQLIRKVLDSYAEHYTD